MGLISHSFGTNYIPLTLTITNNDPYSNLKQQQEDCEKVREDYFEPITQEGVNRFLDTY